MYILPNFNLIINYWVPGNPVSNPPDGVIVGNLTPGKRVTTQYWDWTSLGSPLVTECLLVPAGSGVTSDLSAGGAYTVEVDAGSGWYYKVDQVLRIAHGFANEHEMLVLEPLIPTPQ